MATENKNNAASAASSSASASVTAGASSSSFRVRPSSSFSSPRLRQSPLLAGLNKKTENKNIHTNNNGPVKAMALPSTSAKPAAATTASSPSPSSSVPSLSVHGRSSLAVGCSSFLAAVAAGPTEAQHALNQLRAMVLFDGVPDEPKHLVVDSVRGRVWKIMMGLGAVSADEYIQLINKGKSNKYIKIRGDSFRTFPRDAEFKAAVGEVELIRVLNSFVNEFAPAFTYCQGMNTICAPFLYCLPEVEAYYAFSKLITVKTPLYWLSAHIGVEAGCVLVDECLAVVDKQLFDHLSDKRLQAYVYAFHCVSSLSASIPPFRELLKLWDFLLSFGPHFNILCVVAQIISLRKELLESANPKEILDYRKWPELRASFTISVAMALLPQLPAPLYERICRHASDAKVAAEITGRKVE